VDEQVTTELLIVADDLTGALDSAAPFAAAGCRVAVARRPGSLRAAAATGAGVLAVATGTREGTAEAAEAEVAALAGAVRALEPARLFKKVDSRLKGHVAVETAALARLAGVHSVLACPAIPELGRVVRAGSVAGAGVAVPIPVAPAFGTMEGLEVADAATEADLDAVVARLGPGILLAGARGLAGALARSLGGGADRLAREPWPQGPVLLAVGSRDPVTLEQVAALRGRVPEVAAPDGALDAEAALRALAGGAALVRMSGDGTDPLAGRRFAASVAEVLDRMPPAVLFACGGETADAILAARGIEVLEVREEPFPGVPRARARTAAGPLEVVTKSGGLGSPRLLDALVAEIGCSRTPRDARRTG
jgi:uncharacterized protein YgbK (DUF1537 family)